MQNKVYKLRSQDRSKTVFVNLSDYQTTLDYQHKSGLDTSISRDFTRIGFTARNTSRIETCDDSCGKPRVETCNWNTPILYGMKPGYYQTKIDQLLITAVTALMVAAEMKSVEVGIQPDFGSSIELDLTHDSLEPFVNEILTNIQTVKDVYKAEAVDKTTDNA